MESWGNFFDQAPTSEAGVPVAAMRAAARAPSSVFGKSVAIPEARPVGPSTMLQSPPPPRMDIPQPEMLKMPTEASHEISDIGKSIAGIINPESQKEDKGDFNQRMSAIDAQLQAMAEERKKMAAAVAANPNAAKGSGTTLTGTAEGIFGNMIKQESGGTHFSNGKIITSPAGALGIAQIMPGTAPEAAKLAGLPWNPELFNRGPTGDPAKDAEARDYNLALGKAYYEAQLKTFGDPILAAAAYNAGPGNVQRALEKAKETGRHYAEFLPPETQNYIAVVGRPPAEKKAEGGRVRYLRSLLGA